MLHEFIAEHRDELIGRCRAKVLERSIPVPTEAEIDHGVPAFLDILSNSLRLRLASNPALNSSATQHGYDVQRLGFTVSQVVHDYGDVCQAITQLAVEKEAPISADDFRMLNRCLDDAIAGAVTEYGRGRDRSALDAETDRGNERLGFLAHELRNLINVAMISFDVLKTGNVGVGGSTGTVLQRSLIGLNALVSRSLAEVRLTQGVQNREQFLVAGFIEELTPAAVIEAEQRGATLTVAPVAEDVAIEGDRQVLTAVVGNLLQNAFKFTRPGTNVTLRVAASPERVLIEIVDECDGLPGGNADDLFRPYEQRSADRSGLGLGLAFSRWGVQANAGRIYGRNRPEGGCVFTIDLPRLPVLAFAEP